MKKAGFFFFVFFALSFLASSQEHLEQQHKKTALISYFEQGHLKGQIRNFSMATFNHGPLNDYHATAIGASFHYETKPIKGFSLGMNGLFVYRLFSNSLNAQDSRSNRGSAFEIQLFDVEHRGNYTDLDRLEELYIKYQRKNLQVTFGKMEIHSPLVNAHDGRMKPKVFSGAKLIQKTKNAEITAAFFTKASPRSTTHWYSIGDAIGIYNNGYLNNGLEAHYHEKIKTRGLGVFGIESNKNKKIQLKIWEYYLDNISNTTLLNLEHNSDSSFYGGLMYMNQRVVKNGGNVNSEHAYYSTANQTDAFSLRIAYHFAPFSLQLNATRILDSGKFLFPREFGVDPFYTFISRSQMEGYGDAKSLGVNVFKTIKQTEFRMDWVSTWVKNNLSMNKYNIPSYDQFNIDINRTFQNALEGLKVRFLYAFRMAKNDDLSDEIAHNRLNFSNINLIFNYNF